MGVVAEAIRRDAFDLVAPLISFLGKASFEIAIRKIFGNFIDSFSSLCHLFDRKFPDGWAVNMATAGEMVARTAEVFGVNVSTLESIDRTLVVAGLRHKGGRGRSGAHMTARDISHLAIAAAHDVSMKDAATLVGKISALPRSLSRFRYLPASDDTLDGLGEGTDWSLPPPADEFMECLPGANTLLSEPVLGAAMSRVVDGLAGCASGGEVVQVTISFSNQGPKATILYQVGRAQLEIFYMPPKDERVEPAVDRSFRLPTKVLGQLAGIVHGDREAVT